MKTYIMADIEANGPIPGDYSMTSLGAVIVDEKDAVNAKEAMQKFKGWILKNSLGTPVFISDNNGFDWMFVCWYFWHFLGENPFGYNSHNLNSLYKGLKKDLYSKLDFLRKRNLTHDALEDAKDNAKIFHELRKKFFKKNV